MPWAMLRPSSPDKSPKPRTCLFGITHASIGDLDAYQLPDAKGYASMVRYLTERLPVMICPRWVFTKVQPIAIELFYEHFGLPGFVIAQANRITVKEGAPALEEHNPLPYAKNVFVPVLFVQALGDRMLDVLHGLAVQGGPIQPGVQPVHLQPGRLHRCRGGQGGR